MIQSIDKNRGKPELSPRHLLYGIVAAAIVFSAYSSFYTVSAESVGVVQRFGHYHEVVD